MGLRGRRFEMLVKTRRQKATENFVQTGSWEYPRKMGICCVSGTGRHSLRAPNQAKRAPNQAKKKLRLILPNVREFGTPYRPFFAPKTCLRLCSQTYLFFLFFSSLLSFHFFSRPFFSLLFFTFLTELVPSLVCVVVERKSTN